MYNIYLFVVFVWVYFGLSGLVMVVLLVCLLGVKVFVLVWCMLVVGLIDVVVVGGVDLLCLIVLYGFNLLELLLC